MRGVETPATGRKYRLGIRDEARDGLLIVRGLLRTGYRDRLKHKSWVENSSLQVEDACDVMYLTFW